MKHVVKIRRRTLTHWHRPVSRLVNRLHVGDCLDFLKAMPSKSIGCIVTSPPYNLSNSTGGQGYDNRWKRASQGGIDEGYDTTDDAMPHDEYVAWQREVLKECGRVLKSNGVMFYNHKWRTQAHRLQRLADEITEGFPVRQIVTWQRNGSINNIPSTFMPNVEQVYVIAKKKWKPAPATRKFGLVWKISHETNTWHPAPMPLELAERCVKAGNGSPVLDPFSGSGTTALACLKLDVDYIGVDSSKAYTEKARKRLSQFSRQVRLSI